jgi:hypothetical protein
LNEEGCAVNPGFHEKKARFAPCGNDPASFAEATRRDDMERLVEELAVFKSTKCEARARRAEKVLLIKMSFGRW